MGYIDKIAQQGIVIPIFTSVPAGGVALRRQNVARVRVEAGEAQSWRVILQPLVFREPTPGDILDFTSGVPNKPLAIVTFGTDGVQQTADVDWPINGGAFTVWGDAVTVDVQIPNTWITGIGPSSVVAGAAIVPAGESNGIMASRCAYSGLVPGAAAFSGPIPVPPFAKAFRWHQSLNLAAGNTPCPITWYATIDLPLAVAVQTSPTGVFTSSPTTWPSDYGFTLTPDARYVIVQNNRALVGDSISLTLEFLLNLG